MWVGGAQRLLAVGVQVVVAAGVAVPAGDCLACVGVVEGGLLAPVLVDEALVVAAGAEDFREGADVELVGGVLDAFADPQPVVWADRLVCGDLAHGQVLARGAAGDAAAAGGPALAEVHRCLAVRPVSPGCFGSRGEVGKCAQEDIGIQSGECGQGVDSDAVTVHENAASY